MALRINHNLAALNAHRNLVNTNESLQHSMQSLSSGFRINRGADDPAGLVISEQFRAQIAGLNRAIQNSEGSISMIQTAEGAISEINNLLVSMRELAIHAANEGFNDADQLAADQAEIANAIATIDRIAANTQFGTKKLLDGTKENVATISGANLAAMTIKSSGLTTGTHYVSAVKTADPEASLNSSSAGFTLAGTKGDPYNLEEKIYNMNVVQASDGAAKVGDTNVYVTDDFGNGIKFQTAAHAAVMASAVAMAGSADAATTYTFVINYWEAGTTTTGNVTVNAAIASGDAAPELATAFQAAIAGTALEGKVIATGSALNFSLKSVGVGAEYAMQWQAVTASGGTKQLTIAASDSRGNTIGKLDFTNTTAANAGGTDNILFASSATEYTTMSALVTALQTEIDADATTVAGTSSKSDFFVQAYQTNKLEFKTRDGGSGYSLKLDATSNASLLKVLGLTADTVANTGVDARITLDGYSNSITKVDYDQTMSNLTMRTAASPDGGTVVINVANSEGGLDIGSYLLDVKATKFDVRLDGGTVTQMIAGKYSKIYNGDRTESVEIKYGLTSTGGSTTITNTDQSLVFQIGANVGQTTRISLRNMAATSLGKDISGNMFADLSKIDVTTVQGAQDSQSIIDAAINEVSTSRGTLGSFQKNTLESNLRNLRIASQNLTAAESLIRDTDMAKEMSEFTKNQILVQAGTAMLAQANQLPQIVLSLF